MHAKVIAKALATVVLSAAFALNLDAEVFDSTYTTTQSLDYELITDLLIGPGVARHPSGAKIPQTSSVQVGIYSNLVTREERVSSFTNGVVISTGKIADGSSLVNVEAAKQWADDELPYLGTDADLDSYFGETLSNPAGIVLYVQPRNTTLNIPFVMASEEFFCGSDSVDSPTQESYEQFSDKFAFFLKEIGESADPSIYDASGNVIDDGSPMTENIAKLPDGIGDVEIATVNQHTNSQYFISNVVSNGNGDLTFPANDIALPMEFNGAIVGPVAVAYGLDTNKIYKLKIVIGDSFDNMFNSTVFLRERGITSGADLKIDVDGTVNLPAPGEATITDTVSNIGPATADGVEVKHYLPDGVDAGAVVIEPSVGSIGGFVVEDDSTYFVWNIGDGFAPGATASMTITCTLPNAEVYTNIATVATSTGDYDDSNNRDEHLTTVGALDLTVGAISTNMVYGSALTIPNVEYILFMDGTNGTETVTGIDVSVTNALGEVVDPATAPVGTYGIVLSNISGTGFGAFGTITYLPGLLTIEKAPLEITARNQQKQYGEEFVFVGDEFLVTSGTLASGDSVDSVDLASGGAAASAAYKVGGYPITASNAQGTGLDNYEITYVDGTLVINKAAITITANNQTKEYGEAFTFQGTEFTVTGTLKNSDAVTSVTLASEGAPATAAYQDGGYPITVSDAVGTGLANYEITYAPGILMVDKVAITIIANDQTKEYGEDFTFQGTEYTVTGTFKNSDAVTSVTLASDGAPATAAYNASGYPITVSDAQGTGLANYEITYVPGTLTITKVAITITANDQTKEYGEAFSFQGTEYTVTGTFKGGDGVTSVTLASDGAPATAAYNASGYPITASNAQGTGLANYEIEYVPGTLTITKRAIEITARNQQKPYGEEFVFVGDEFLVTSGELATGDAVDSVTLASEGAAAAAPYAAAGYPITASNAQGTGLDNYVITYVPGTLVINKAAITITANNQTKEYGEEFTFQGTEFTVTGTLKNSDAVTSVTLASDGAPASAAYQDGGYPIAISDAQGTGLANYEITYVPGTLLISKAVITITANDQTKEYGEEFTFQGTEFTVTGTLKNSDGVTSVTLASDGAPATAAYNAAGYPITVSDAVGTGLANYEITYVPGTLTVTKVAITITANDQTKEYGDEFTFQGTEYTVTGTFKGSDGVTSVTLASDGAAAAAAYNASGYPITVSDAVGTGLANYEITYVPGTLAITKRAIEITARNQQKQYGEEFVFVGDEFLVTSGTLATGDSVDSVDLASDGAPATAAYNASGYPITASNAQGTGLDNYVITYVPGTLMTNKAAITITANDQTKEYGEEFTFQGTEFTVTGTLKNSDAVTSVTLASDGAPASAAYNAAGYPITVSDAVGTGLANYEITYVPGTLTITKVAITITANDQTKEYGEDFTFQGTEFTVTGTLKNSDAVTSVTLASDGAPSSAAYNAAGYPITASDAVGTGLDNYEITYVPGTLTITKAAITITANDQTKEYGEEFTFQGTEFTVTGTLKNSDAVTSVTLASDGAVATAAYNASGYPITVSDAVGTGLANYEITYVPGTLAITKRAIEITARNQQKQYGEEFVFVGDEFLVTSGTLATGDSVDSVDLASDGAAASAVYKVGGYPITASNAQGTGLANYEITYVSGTLTINKAAITITANDQTKVYGEEFTFQGTEFTVTGTLKNSDAVTSVTLASDGAPASAAYNASGYPITASDAVGTGLANYEITYVPGTFTITKAAITITANDQTKEYGEEFTFQGTEFTVTGTLKNSDAVTSVTLASDGAPASAAYNASGYPITASDAVGTGLDNYEITYNPGTLTITKAAITITANDQTKEYGEEFTFQGTEFTVTGTLKNSDAVTSVTLASDGAVAIALYNASGYPITVSDAVGTGLANYEITYVPGTLTITKRAIEITARNQQKPYGEEFVFVGDEFLVTSGTLATGDSVDSVTLASDGAVATAAWKAEGYPIVASDAQGTGLDNYEITYVDGTLIITKRSITITANDAEKEYGEAKTFEGTEFTVSGDLQNGDQVTSVYITGEMATNVAAAVGVYADDVAPSYPVTGIDTNNYDIVFSNGTLTVTQAVITITVNDATWKAGKPRPDYSFADFSAQLKGGDAIADVTGGTGAASDVAYTNVVWNTADPTTADAGVYQDEIWIDAASVDGARAANYIIEIVPGALTVTDVEAELTTSISASLNWNTGLLDLSLTIKNEGDGEVDPDYDYWVELKPGVAGEGATASVEKTYYIDSPTGTIPDGYDYLDLTAKVKAALRSVGNRDEVFDPGESITLTGVSVYHWKRWAPSRFIDQNSFFVAGRLFNEADTNRDFVISEAEKTAAASLLGTSSNAYLEVSRLALLDFYHWKSSDGTWQGDSH